jgi:hypothetical protein
MIDDSLNNTLGKLIEPASFEAALHQDNGNDKTFSYPAL